MTHHSVTSPTMDSVRETDERRMRRLKNKSKEKS